MIVALLDWSISAQVVVNGLALGLGYSVIAAGIVLIYRSSGIVNFAQVAMGAFGVASFVVLFQNYDLPYPVAMALGVAGAVVLGVVTELLVVRRLFDASRVVLLIATVGVAQLAQREDGGRLGHTADDSDIWPGGQAGGQCVAEQPAGRLNGNPRGDTCKGGAHFRAG